ncbi:MAG TPA: SDR family NAD(P)-dependent oxidoreductase, partial [Paracoccaceae bacterium]
MSGIALITGGQQGIGLGIAEALVAAGYRVALASRSAGDTPAVLAALARLGPATRYFSHDLQDIGGAAGLVDRVEAE